MKKGLYIWAGVIALLLFVYATKAILLPFLVGLAVAYLLDPVTDKFELIKLPWGKNKNLPRWIATVMTLVLFFFGAGGVLAAIFPLVKTQVFLFIQNLPDYIAAARPVLEDMFSQVTRALNIDSGITGESFLESAARTALDKTGVILAGFWSGGMALFNLLMLLLITPVTAFFLLRDWDILMAKVVALLPRDKAPAIRKIGRDIDTALGGFVRGQTLSALVMAVLYGLGWSLVGLEFALVLGLIGGLMAYIPFVGALFTFLLAMLIGLGQFGLDVIPLLKIAAVYAVVQGVEAAVLTPRLIGSHVRLHPVWVLFAIFAGGELMGFVGVLIAIPAAAVAGVLIRHTVERYLASPLHEGTNKKKKAG